MKIIKNLFQFIAAFFKTIYKVIDKVIIIPITKFIVMITDKLGNRTDRFEKWITKKNTLIFISLILAIGLFMYVDSESTTIITDSAEVLYGQKVKATYNNNSYVVEGLPKSVDVTLIGRKVDLYLAKQLATGVVTADLSGLGEGMHTIKLEYDCSIRSVEYKLAPSSVNITIYPKVSQTRTAGIEVINKNKLDKKLSIGEVTLSNSEIVIKGAEHTLNKVATVKALVDVSKMLNPKIGITTIDDIKLVAYDENGDVVKGLELEAEDYIIKPFRTRELILRINNILKRYEKSENKKIQSKNVVLDIDASRVYVDEKEIELTALEYKILQLLFLNIGKTVTRDSILDKIWDVAGNYVNDNTLTVYIKRIRSKLGDEDIIKTIKGIGYRIDK